MNQLSVLFIFVCLGINCEFAKCAKNEMFRERVEIYSKLLDCDYYDAFVKNYTDFVELSTLRDFQSDNYSIRFPVYIVGEKNAHISLSGKKFPNIDKDFSYEILMGGWGNSRSVIRKKIGQYYLASKETTNVLSQRIPLRVLFEIVKSGQINVYTGEEPALLITAFDANPIPVKYVSFASHENTQVEFLYNCGLDQNTKPPNMDTPQTLQDRNNNMKTLELVKQCKVYESWEHKYTEFIPFSDIRTHSVNIFDLQLEMYILGNRDAHILLSENTRPNATVDPVYEILIGGWKNSRHFIRRKIGDEVLDETDIPDVLSDKEPVKIIIRFYKNAGIEVFRGDSLYKPILHASEALTIPVKFISFAANEASRVLFFYNCEHDFEMNPSETYYENPLLYPTNETVLNKQCKSYNAWENLYNEFIDLSYFESFRSDKYILRVPLYVHGIRDACILLKTEKNSDLKNSYEIIIGGWDNTRSVINKNGIRIASVNEHNILNESKSIQIIIEFTKDGVISIYTEYNKSKPLLTVKDDKPITDIKYISFTAYYRDVKFYYNCVF